MIEFFGQQVSWAVMFMVITAFVLFVVVISISVSVASYLIIQNSRISRVPETVHIASDQPGGLGIVQYSAGGIGIESGDGAYQAGTLDGIPGIEMTESELKSRAEYEEAMRVLDRQIERATRATLGVNASSEVEFDARQLLDKSFWEPEQAPAPGVSDE